LFLRSEYKHFKPLKPFSPSGAGVPLMMPLNAFKSLLKWYMALLSGKEKPAPLIAG
jgi:hypothetical protein